MVSLPLFGVCLTINQAHIRCQEKMVNLTRACHIIRIERPNTTWLINNLESSTEVNRQKMNH
jgi:hypothetical protein